MCVQGGKPRSSYWFIGVQDGRVLYLDPHTVQAAVGESSALLSSAGCASFHTEQLYSMIAQQLDPSMALGFYIRSHTDWALFKQHAQALEDKHNAYALVRVKATRGWRPASDDSGEAQQRSPVDRLPQRSAGQSSQAEAAHSASARHSQAESKVQQCLPKIFAELLCKVGSRKRCCAEACLKLQLHDH